MKDLIRLPDKFVIKKKLTKDKFLQGANLIDSEKEKIDRLVSSIDLVYDVPFSDNSEIIIIDVALKLRYLSTTDAEVAQIIARSIPHDCIIYVHADGFGMISIFLTRANTNNINRRVIEKQTTSPMFDEHAPAFEIQNLLKEIKHELTTGHISAEIAMMRCICHIEDCRVAYRFDDSVQIKKLSENILTQLEYGAEHKKEVLLYDLNQDSYSSRIRNKKLAIIKTEDALINSAYALYDEVSNNFEENDWLLLYAQCCNDILNDYYNLPATDIFYQKLAAVFFDKEFFILDDDCIYYIKERLEEEYILRL